MMLLYEKLVFIIQWFDIRLRPVSSKPLNDRLKFGVFAQRRHRAPAGTFGYQAVTVSQRAPATVQVGDVLRRDVVGAARGRW